MKFRKSMSCKLIRIMKLTCLFLLILCLQVSAVARAQQVNLHETNVSLESVLMKIKAQSGYQILFNNQMLADATCDGEHYWRITDAGTGCLFQEPAANV
jgi:hypothetical protein